MTETRATRSTGYRTMEAYVEATISDMKETVRFVESGKLDDVYVTVDEKREWAFWAIEQSATQAMGALTFAEVYEERITDEEDRELWARVLKARQDCEHRVWDLNL